MGVISVFLALSLLYTVQCGEVTVTYSPSTVRFGSAGVLRASHLDDVLAAALGYTPEPSPWKGLTVTSPFSLPNAAVVVEVHGGGATVRQEGSTYGLMEDAELENVFSDVKSVVGARAQRETSFQRIVVDNNVIERRLKSAIPSSKVLSLDQEPDATFLREMAAMVDVTQKSEDEATAGHGGQDVIFIQVKSLALLVKTYGDQSPQVREAESILRGQLAQVTKTMRHIYNDQVVVATAMLDRKEDQSRSKRSILQTEPESDDINEATEYSSDYPAVFNIIPWLSIILLLSILAVAVAMATMDPGRDSIIYRMTNPRMKKDN